MWIIATLASLQNWPQKKTLRLRFGYVPLLSGSHFFWELLVSVFLSLSENQQILTSKKSNYGKHGFIFLPPLKGTFDLLHIHLIRLKNQQFSFNKLFCYFYIPCCHLKKIQNYCRHPLFVSKTIIRFYQWMQMIIRFHENWI